MGRSELFRILGLFCYKLIRPTGGQQVPQPRVSNYGRNYEEILHLALAALVCSSGGNIKERARKFTKLTTDSSDFITPHSLCSPFAFFFHQCDYNHVIFLLPHSSSVASFIERTNAFGLWDWELFGRAGSELSAGSAEGKRSPLFSPFVPR